MSTDDIFLNTCLSTRNILGFFCFFFRAADDPQVPIYSACTHLLFFCYGILRQMSSTPSVVPHVLKAMPWPASTHFPLNP